MKAIRSASLSAVVLLFTLVVLVLPPNAHAQRQQFKGIFEPVNVPDDFRLNSVFFVNANVGWIAAGGGPSGKGGIILHTQNGGEKWDIQVGDPRSLDLDYKLIHFLDARHGWAVQHERRLMRTTDGKTWNLVGSIPNTWITHMQFLTPQRGMMLAGSPNTSTIYSTGDGGRTWKTNWECVAQVEIQGLNRRVRCHLYDMKFVNGNVAYAAGGSYNRGGFGAIAKSEDGGANWRVIFASAETDRIEAIAFIDPNRGVFRTVDSKLFVTQDGGQSWRGITSTGVSGDLQFADPSVGWSCSARSCAVTADGGQTWTSRALRLPAVVKAYSVPRRDRVYVIGDHGMVYRYRIVPADYTAKNISDAPPISGYSTELTTQLADMQKTANDLQTRAAAGQSDAFVQDPAFVQAVATLENRAGIVEQQGPAFAESHRNLNLFHVGSNMVDDMKQRGTGIRDLVRSLKSAPDLKTALGTLQQLTAQLSDTYNAVSEGFTQLAATSSDGGQQVLRGTGGSAAPDGGQPGAQQGGEQGQQQGQQQGQGAGEAVELLKRGLQRIFR